MAADSLPAPDIRVHDPTRGRFGNARRIELCRPAVGAGFDHIAHFTSGGLDFSLDALGEPHEPGPAERRHLLLSGLGKQLTGWFGEIGRAVRPWHSGDLIRLVLQGTGRFIVCNTVTTEQLLVSSAPVAAPGLMHEQDRRAAELADELRALVELPTQNPGGFRTGPPGGPADASPAEPDGPQPQRQEPCDELTPEIRGERTLAADAMRGAVHPADLHFAAYIRGGVWRCSADVLDHPRLVAYFSPDLTGDVRRAQYHEFGTELCIGAESLLGQLTLDLEDQIGELRRIVIDVEQGAFYGYRLGNDDFALGVTLAQNKVQRADEKMERLVAAIAG